MATSPLPPPDSRRVEAAPASTGVLLIAHGSARSGESAEPVLELARALARRGFPEVRTAFWKEEPFLHQALDTVRSARVVVLPVFLAEGYFSRVVVPRELGLVYGDNTRGPRTARLLPPLGADPGLDRLVIERAQAALPGGRTAADATLVVLGHGTPRDPGSADAVLAVCARLRARGGFAHVAPAFIDQEPRLDQVVGEAAADGTVLVVPFLVAAGFHGGAMRTETERDSRIVYAEPVGTHPGLIDLIERLVREREPTPATAGEGAEASSRALESVLSDQIARGGLAVLLEVEIRALEHPPGAYALRHAADVGADEAALRELSDIEWLTALARRTASGVHRPLRTAADLPRGWRYRARDVGALVEALIALYGPAVVHWYAGERGGPPVQEFAEVAARQTGIYAELQQVEPAAVQEGIRRVCDGLPCLRVRLWGPSSRRPPQTTRGAGLVVPCPAPCPILLGAVLDLPPE